LILKQHAADRFRLYRGTKDEVASRVGRALESPGSRVTEKGAYLPRNTCWQAKTSLLSFTGIDAGLRRAYEGRGVGPQDAAVTLVTKSAYFLHLAGGIDHHQTPSIALQFGFPAYPGRASKKAVAALRD
jgi:hypothetical protein